MSRFARYRLLILIPLVIPRSAFAEEAQFIPLGDLPGGDFLSVARGISGDGLVVVGGSKSGDAQNGYESFRWTMSSGMVGLGTLDPQPGQGFSGNAQAASFDGSVIVGNSPGPYRWTQATGMIDLADLSTTGFMMHNAMDVSGDGSVVVGHGRDPGIQSSLIGFRWSVETGAIGIGGLSSTLIDSFASGVSSDGSVLGGQSMSGPPDVEAIRWTQAGGLEGLGVLTVLELGFSYSLAWGISADGQVIVGQARTDDFEEAFYWRAETGMVSLDPLRGTTLYSNAEDASEDGSIIVGVQAGDAVRDGAMIWDAGYGMRNIQEMLEDDLDLKLELTGWDLRYANAVSDDGTRIVGWGFNPSGDIEGWLAVIPPYCRERCGDVDGSGEATNLSDFTAFATCLESGDATSQSCLCSDLNGDAAIDLADYAIFTQIIDTESFNAIPNCVQ